MSDYPELAGAIAEVERVYQQQVKARADAVRRREVTDVTDAESPLYAYRFERVGGRIVEIRKDSDGPPSVVERPDLT